MEKIYSYTKNQPQNVEAWRFGEACRAAADEPKCGDLIDRGLILLRELEAKGYGIVKLPPNDRVEGRGAASSRRVPSHDGLCGNGTEVGSGGTAKG